MKDVCAATVLGLALAIATSMPSSATPVRALSGAAADPGPLVHIESNGWGDRINKTRSKALQSQQDYPEPSYGTEDNGRHGSRVRHGRRPRIGAQPVGPDAQDID